MPLVRIDIIKNSNPEHIKRIGSIVYESMKDAINVPDNDNFQILNEHDKSHFVFDPGYLGINRTNGIVFIQITLNSGRSIQLKKHLYKTIADRLHNTLNIRREDVFINLIEVDKENWSFGNGIAQYAN